MSTQSTLWSIRERLAQQASRLGLESHWWYIGPVLLFYIPFFILPTVALFGLGFFTWTGFGAIEFAGLSNYVKSLSDPVVYTAIWHNVQIAIIGLVLNFTLGLGLAIAIRNAYSRFRQFFQTAFLIPMAMMPVAVAFVWSFIYNPSYGVMNELLAMLPIVDWQPLWLADQSLALYAIILVGTWQWTGFNAVIWLAGLENIDERLYEAARIDGASKLQMFRYVTMPQLRPIAIFVFIFSLISAFRVFGYYWVMTRGGPGHATEVMVTYIYKIAFMEQQLGTAAALSVILFAITLVVSLVNFYIGTGSGSGGTGGAA